MPYLLYRPVSLAEKLFITPGRYFYAISKCKKGELASEFSLCFCRLKVPGITPEHAAFLWLISAQR